ncbi:MAG: hypothetical protein LUD72_11425 [Bacteroidales bacterium]|nr:hypothetical protein [Bacteroidales bacterium]
MELKIPDEIKGKDAEPIEPVTQTLSFESKAAAALAALGVSTHDKDGNEKDVSELLTELKTAMAKEG